jgi:hypothetical protein
LFIVEANRRSIMSKPNRIHPQALVMAAAILLVLAFTLVITAMPGTTGAAHAVQRTPLRSTPVKFAPIPRESLDTLRIEALQGDVDASEELAQRLLDRFEQTGDEQNLYEAFQWITRDWDQVEFLRTDVIQRAVANHCDGPVLRWHWLCVAGE